MALHAFVDESQGPPYRMVIAMVESEDASAVRSEVRRWRYRGSKRFHAAQERHSRRSLALDSLMGLPVRLVIVEAARGQPVADQRQDAVTQSVMVAIQSHVSALVFEDAASERTRDLATIARLIAGHDSSETRYGHTSASQEPLLWIPDLVAWAYQRGGSWRSRVKALNRVQFP